MGQPHPNERRQAIAEGPPLEPRPDAVRTLPQWLSRAARQSSSGIIFVSPNGDEHRCSYAELLTAAERRLTALRQRGLTSGQKVILLAQNTPDFVELFWGCLLGGMVPVLLSPPKGDFSGENNHRESNEARRLAAVWQQLDCPPVIVPERLDRLRDTITSLSSRSVTQWWSPDALRSTLEDGRWHLRAPGSTALLLFSSGSTRDPQGVRLTHDNLWANVQATCQHNRLGTLDNTLCFAPLYHVIGLVCFHLLPVYTRANQVMFEPGTLLKRPELWLEKISKHRVTFTGGPNFAYSLATDRITPDRLLDWDLSCLRVLLNGGEVVSVNTLQRFHEKFRSAGLRSEALAPAFGMSESAGGIAYPRVDQRLETLSLRRVASTSNARQTASHATATEYANLGEVLPGITLRVVDEEDRVVDEGVVGNLQIRGRTVTPGYEADPAATNDSFIEGWFRTGDLGFLRDGQLAVVGRSKDVIIVHGHNYYAHDLEQAARDVPGVVADRVVAIGSFSETLGRDRVVVFVVLQNLADEAEVQRAIEHEVLRRVGVRVDTVVPLADVQFPRTSAGKNHRYELKKRFEAGAFDQRIDTSQHSAVAESPRTAKEPSPGRPVGQDVDRAQNMLAEMLARVLAVDVEHIDPLSSFVELGIDSVLAVQLVRDLEDRLAIELPTTLAYDHPNIQALAEFLVDACRNAGVQGFSHEDPQKSVAGEPDGRQGPARVVRAGPVAASSSVGADGESSHKAIAIVGMSARLPGANSVEEYWSNLRQGVCSIREIPPERWDMSRYYSPRPGEPGKTISKWAGMLEGVDRFDARLFGISPHEAQQMDPQQRLLMEVCWETLESAGYGASNLAGSDTGVFVGISLNDYMRGLLAEPNTVDAYIASGNFLSIAANRLSYALDLKGPSLAVDTACSSSLVALHLAVRSLRCGECHAAIVGTAHLHFTPELYVNFSQAGMLSADGRLKAFDRRADGYVRGEGVAAVLLKPLVDAQRDGDFIHAVVRGTAVNQDGRTNGLTAPNRESQVQVIRQAHRDAEVAPHEISYVEAHGTGTRLGDPIELQALGEVFGTGRGDVSCDGPGGRCGIGSVKTNLGHLEPASGLASLIKVVLSLEHQQLAPTLNFEQPSDHTRFEQLSLYVVDRPRPWRRGSTPRLAGVSAFGFGGTNAHVVVQEAPVPVSPPEPLVGPYALTVSAQSVRARDQLAGRMADHLESHPERSLADVCFTANTGRKKHQHRAAVVAMDRIELVARLRSLSSETPHTSTLSEGIVAGDVKDKSGTSQLINEAARVFGRLEPVGRQVFRRLCREARLPEPLQQMATTVEHEGEAESQTPWSSLSLAQRTTLLTLLCLLDTAGVDVNWALLDDRQSCRRVPLPTYPFQRQHFPLVRQGIQSTQHDASRGQTASNVVEESGGPHDAAPSALQATSSDLVDRIRRELATVLGVAPEEVEPETNYTELGLDSIMATHVARRLDPDEHRGLDALLLFTYPTVRELAEYLAEEFPEWHADIEQRASGKLPTPHVATSAESASTVDSNDDHIAIVGMACRMPGANTPEAWWQQLQAGKDMTGELPEARRVLHPSPPAHLRRGGFLDDIAGFDPGFFGLTLREARLIDPRQRLMLEVAWQAIQSSGHHVDELSQATTGVFVGVAHNDYEKILQMAQRRHDAQYAVGNAASMVANRVSYTLNLTGPSIAVDTACSSSLVAVHMACESLRRGETSWAVAGGVNLILLPDDTQALDAAGMLSSDTRSMAFDDRANGYVRGEGVAAVLLRPLSEALAAGDTVLAVIRGTAVNHDGHSKVGVTAPNPKAQRQVLEAAYRQAGISPHSVTLLEAHGTGTRLGDPIEVQALSELFRNDTTGRAFCALGSVKSNVGHLEAAAGIAGLMKVVLSLGHQQLPPTLHVETPNQHVAWAGTPFYINERLRPWDVQGPRRAGVSSFGAGGTNAHVVLEEAPAVHGEIGANKVFAARSRCRDAMPSDPFHREHCWVDVSFSAEHGSLPLAAGAASNSRSISDPGTAVAGDDTAAAGRWLVDQLSEVLEIPREAIDCDRPVSESGLDSMLATQLARLLEQRLGKKVPPTICFDYPTVKQLAIALVEQYEFRVGNDEATQHDTQVFSSRRQPRAVHTVEKKPLRSAPSVALGRRTVDSDHDRRIAIIGLSGRFPDAPSIEAFWQNLATGHDSVREIPPWRWSIDRHFDADKSIAGKTYSKWGALLDDIDQFDAPLFHISPREAAAMDPQQRLLLEVAWETLERAGYAGGRLSGTRTGVFVGTMASEYLPRLLEHPESLGTHVGTGNAASVIANRLSYMMNFKGPCLAIDTACSSSLVALHLAIESLRRGECDCALVGGTQAALAVSHYQVMSRLGALSPTGRCRAFDGAADGYVLGEGVGMVLLKPFAKATADGDHIDAVILGSATNHAGQSAGLTVPNADAQSEVIREALADANVAPESLSYIEAHGTGTRLGDPIEMQGLTEVFAGKRRTPQSCGLGSVKTNIGHLESAAGIAGLLKVVLSLGYGQLPPSLHLVEPNRHLAFERSPFYVNDRLIAWPKSGDAPRRAGVSAFGFGGTNAHVVIEEAPLPAAFQREDSATPGRSSHVLLLSARDAKALDELTTRWADHLQSHASLPVGDVTYTAATGREHFAQRLAVAGHDTAELTTRLNAAASSDASRSKSIWRGRATAGRRPRVAVLFSGQGAQYAGMGRVLYDTQPVFRQAWDACAEQLSGELDRPLAGVLASDAAASELLSQTAYAQPALFALQHALWQMWRSWDLDVEAVVGHSVGEYAAACAAGVLSWSDGAQLVARRARFMQALPDGGTMAAVLAPLEEFATRLTRFGDSLSVAAINSPGNTVISGDTAAIEELLAELRAQNIACQPLEVSHAFHSRRMEPMLESLRAAALGLPHGPSQLTWITNLTGAAWTEQLECPSDYWSRQARGTVQFATCIEALFRDGYDVLLELGPGTTLTSLSSQVCRPLRGESLGPQSVSSLCRGQDDWQPISAAAAQLYTAGVDLDWESFHHPQRHRRQPLPTYPFQRQRYWVDGQQHDTTPTPPLEESHAENTTEVANWLHEIRWRPVAKEARGLAADGTWLIVDHATGIGREIVAQFSTQGCAALLASVDVDTRGARSITLDTGQQTTAVNDFNAVLDRAPELAGIVLIDGRQYDQAIGQQAIARPLAERARHHIESATAFLRTLARQRNLSERTTSMGLWSFTFAAHRVTDDDATVDPVATAMVGLMRSARLELPSIAVRSVDLPATRNTVAAATQISQILGSDIQYPEIAVRDGQYWEPVVVRSNPSAQSTVSNLPTDGVYLITGGVGGLGLETARMLAERGKPKLVLISRSAVAGDNVDALKAAGAEVHVVRADVADRDALAEVLETTRRRYGPIDGIFHAAGVTQDALLRNVDATMLGRVMRAKVQGTLWLDALTRDNPPGVLVLYSSLASLSGNIGQSAYAAANAFLDGYTAARRAEGARHITCINWGPWSGVGMAADPAIQRNLKAAGLSLIEPALGRRLLLAAVNGSPGQQAIFQLRTENVTTGDAPNVAAARVLSSLNPVPRDGVLNSPAKEHAETKSATHRLHSTAQIGENARTQVREVFGAALDLAPGDIDGDTSFRDLGVDSLLAEEAIDALRRRLHLPGLVVSLIYEYPTVHALADHLVQHHAECFETTAVARREASTRPALGEPHRAVATIDSRASLNEHDIAVVGYACRFPGCEDATAYWRVLRDGVDCVAAMPRERWDIARSYDPQLVERFGDDRPVGGFLRDIQSFDPQLFRISPAEARQMDPRQRLFLEVAYQAAEHAGCGGAALSNSNCGVFVGCGANDYLLDVPGTLLTEHSATGSTTASVASRLAYCLNLRGPCLPVDTACSSSLVALHLAIESLRRGECRWAFAGAVHLHLRLGAYQALRELGALSPSGQCRPFDEQADGFVPGEGSGVVLMRPLRDAVAAGDRIYGVIKGAAVNNDGRTNGLTAPSPRAQVDVLQAAWRDAKVAPDSISYFEAHGTGTVLGDPIEAQSLITALGENASRKPFRGLGSVKSNLGHLDAAAGMASLIKVLLSFEHEQLPPTLHVGEPNRRIRFEDGPLSLVTAVEPWRQGDNPRRAGISAFGFSGTNAHVVVEEPPRLSPAPPSTRPVHLLTLSAHDSERLDWLCNAYRDCIAQHTESDLADVCFTANTGRWHLPVRTAVVAVCREEMIAALDTGHLSDRGTFVSTASCVRLESSHDEAQRSRQVEQATSLLQGLPKAVQALVLKWCSGAVVNDLVNPSADSAVSSTTPMNEVQENASDPNAWNRRTWNHVAHLVAQLYVLGAEVDFVAMEGDARRRRLPVPTYPLRREKYWLPIGRLEVPATAVEVDGTNETDVAMTSAKNDDVVLGTTDRTDRLFYEVHWEAEALDRASVVVAATRVLLVHGADEASTSIAECVATRLNVAGSTVFVAQLGSAFRTTGEDRFEIDPLSVEDYRALFEAVDDQASPLHIVHFGAYGVQTGRSAEELDQRLNVGLRSVLHLIKAVDRLQAAKPVQAAPMQVTVVTRGAMAIADAKPCTSPEGAATWGLLKVAALEMSNVAFRAVDFADDDRDAPSCVADAEGLLDELSTVSKSAEIAYRDERRFVSRVRQASLSNVSPSSSPLRSEGVYLITGGLGGIGLALAGWLVEHHSARIVLVGRTRLSERANQGAGNPAEIVAKLRQSGAEIWCTAADVTNRSAMAAVFAEAQRRFGRIDGVFHCAGVIHRARLRDVTTESFDEVLRSKVHGCWVLDELLRDNPHAPLVLFSSVAGIDGNIFQGDYSAASRFLDSFAAWRTAQGRPTISIDWGLWSEVGMGAALARRLADRGRLGLSTAEALDAMQRALASGQSHIVIDAARWAGSEDHSTAALATSPSALVPRAGHVERAVTALLASVLETDAARLDRRTGLLDFGLDSMLALKLVRKFENATAARLPVTLPFDYPTIEALAARLIAVISTEGLSRLIEFAGHRSREEDSREPDEADAGACGLPPRTSVLRDATGRASPDFDDRRGAAGQNGNSEYGDKRPQGDCVLRLKTGRRVTRLQRRRR